ncbi:hypothetical protein [Streptomyces sp. MUSC 14]|uniref:hypothetical protein n=1 Tax=Streptomyces sp. MUSC 14 TaxID=1354889 RepID=UPI0011603952|nr:hypothetical protein [Streptomyces sp. MUSC 14]
MTALAAGLAGYSLTAASAASAADNNAASVVKKDCVKAGPAARFSFKPICPAEPPSKTEEAVTRGVNDFTTFGVSELLGAAHTTNEHSGDPGCTGNNAAHLSRKPLCPQRELTGLEKGLRDLTVGMVLPSPAKFAPAEIQTLNTLRGIGAGTAAGATKLDSMLHDGSEEAQGGQKPDSSSPQTSSDASSQASDPGPLRGSVADWNAARAMNGLPPVDANGQPLNDGSSQGSDAKSRQKRDLPGEGAEPAPGQTSDPSQSADASDASPGQSSDPTQSTDPSGSSPGSSDGAVPPGADDGASQRSDDGAALGSDDVVSPESKDAAALASGNVTIHASDGASTPVWDVGSASPVSDDAFAWFAR